MAIDSALALALSLSADRPSRTCKGKTGAKKAPAKKICRDELQHDGLFDRDAEDTDAEDGDSSEGEKQRVANCRIQDGTRGRGRVRGRGRGRGRGGYSKSPANVSHNPKHAEKSEQDSDSDENSRIALGRGVDPGENRIVPAKYQKHSKSRYVSWVPEGMEIGVPVSLSRLGVVVNALAENYPTALNLLNIGAQKLTRKGKPNKQCQCVGDWDSAFLGNSNGPTNTTLLVRVSRDSFNDVALMVHLCRRVAECLNLERVPVNIVINNNFGSNACGCWHDVDGLLERQMTDDIPFAMVLVEHATNQSATVFVDNDLQDYMLETNALTTKMHKTIVQNWDELEECQDAITGYKKMCEQSTTVIHRLKGQVEVHERTNMMREFVHRTPSDVGGVSSAADAAALSTAKKKQSTGEKMNNEDVKAMFMRSATLMLENDWDGLRCMYDHSAAIAAKLELERAEQQRVLEMQKALDDQKALDKQKAEDLEKQKALEKQNAEDLEKQNALEKQKALDKQKAEDLEKQKALEKQNAEDLEKQKALEKQNAEDLEKRNALEKQKASKMQMETTAAAKSSKEAEAKRSKEAETPDENHDAKRFKSGTDAGGRSGGEGGSDAGKSEQQKWDDLLLDL